MKFKLTLLFVGCLMLTSCREKKTVKLRLNLPKGYSVKVTEITDGQTRTIRDEGEIAGSNTINHTEYQLECLAVEPNGVMTIRKTWLSAKAKMEHGKNDQWTIMMDFDSRDQDKKQRSFYLEPVIGQSVTLKISPNGNILGCSGNEELAQKIIETDTNIATYPEEAKANLLKGFSNSLQSLPCILAAYPDKSLAIGTSWRQPWGKYDSASCLLYTWTLKKMKNGLAEIEVKAVDLPIPQRQQQDSQTKSDMKQNATINLLLDMATGVIKSCQGRIKVVGSTAAPRTDSREPNKVEIKNYEIIGGSTFTIETSTL